MNDMYITVSNISVVDQFTNNTPYNFKVLLDQYLDFNSNYECALVDFTCSTARNPIKFKHIYIYFNMVEEQPVGGGRQSLIRHTLVQANKLQMEAFAVPYYMPVKQMKTNILEINIKDEYGADASFLRKTTTCTFHVRKKKWQLN